MFEKTTEQLVKQILSCIEKGKRSKIEKIIKNNKDNLELFDKLLKEDLFIKNIGFMDNDLFPELNIEIQKQIIRTNLHFIRVANFQVRSDLNFIKELISNKDYPAQKIEWVYRSASPNVLKSLNLIEEYPSAFIDSIKYVDYTIEELKNFFGNNLLYLPDMPPSLKNDIDFVVDCISVMQFKPSYIHNLGGFDFDYLTQDKIKNAIIKKFGDKNYQQILALSLAYNYDQNKLNKLTFEEFKKLIIARPYDFLDLDSKENIFSFIYNNQEYRQNLSLINEINKIDKINFNTINTPENISQILFDLSKILFNELTYENIYDNVNKYWEYIKPFISQISTEYENEENEKYFRNLYGSFKRIYNLLLGIKLNKLEEFSKIFINYDLLGSDYAENIKDIEINDDNIEFLRLVASTKILTLDNNSLKKFNILFQKISYLLKDPYSAVNFLDRLLIDKDIYNLVINLDIDNIDNNLLLKLYNYVDSDVSQFVNVTDIEELRDFNIKNHLTDNHVLNNTLNGKKYMILMKHFNISLATAQNLLHSYFTASNESSLYKENSEIMYLKKLLDKIINAKDKDTLSIVEKELVDGNINIAFLDILSIINKIKRKYGDYINDCLTCIDKEQKICDLSDKDFNLLVHVIGAYGATPKGDVYDSWNTKEGTSNISICTSFITNDNMGIAPTNEHSVILGFSELPTNFLQLMSCRDLYSSGFEAGRNSIFLNPKELKDNTRDGHNELVITRRTGQYADSKIQPSYIVCFDDINEESKIASEKFQIPIIFIDREKVVKRHHNEIKDLIKEFESTLNPYLIEKVICIQENNKAGLRMLRPDLVEKYFSHEFRQSNIELIYSSIQKGLANKHSNAIIAMNEFVRVIECEKQKFESHHESSKRKNHFDIKYEEFLKFFKENPNFKETSKLPREMTTKELYDYFLECRKKLSEKENVELDYLNSNNIILETTNARKVG